METENVLLFAMTPVDVRGNVMYRVDMIHVVVMTEHASEMTEMGCYTCHIRWCNANVPAELRAEFLSARTMNLRRMFFSIGDSVR